MPDQKPVCEQCGQPDNHPNHTGKNIETGEPEGSVDHAPIHTA